MLKKAPSRSIRSKGIKVKHILQIVLLVGVCFWLIYQVKHSHDKKKEFDHKDNEITTKTPDGGDVATLKLGRKDLHPLVEEVNPGEKQEEDEEEETGGEEEDSKHDEFEGHEELKNEALEEEDEGIKHEEETNDDGRGGGDDDIDENDQEKVDNESDREGENVDDEILKEDTDEEAGAGNEEKDKEDQREHENSSDEQDNDIGEESTHEAREENYKGDDASSAVTHDDHSTSSETEDLNLENSNGNMELNSKKKNSESSDAEEFKRIHNTSRLTEEVDKTDGNATSTNENLGDLKSNESISLSNSILTTESNDQPESNNNSSSATTEVNKVESTDSSPQNGTETGLNRAQEDETIDNLTAPNETSLQSLILTNLNDTVLEKSNTESQQNTTSTGENPNGVEGETLNIITSKADEKTTEPEKDDNRTTEPENVLPTMITQENSETGQNEQSGVNGESNGESSYSTNHTEDPVQEDQIDSNDSHVTERVDLDRLADIRSEVEHSEETAAE